VQLSELKASLRKAENDLNMLGEGDGKGGAGGDWGVDDENEGLGTVEPANSLASKRRALFKQLKAKDRRIAELMVEVSELQADRDRLRNARQLTQVPE
jgi:hypothetical protein